MTDKPTNTRKDRLHFYIVAGEISFLMGDTEEDLRTTRLNTILRLSDKNVSVHQIGRAQQALQAQLHSLTGNQADMRILNVVILNISYLGHMTEETFNKAPDDTGFSQLGGTAPSAIGRTPRNSH